MSDSVSKAPASNLLPPEGYYDSQMKPKAYGYGQRRGGGGRGRGRGRSPGGRGDRQKKEEEEKEPLFPLKVLEDRTVSEEEVGIRRFASSESPGFRAILKHLYSDFNVNEVTPEGEVVRLRSTELPADMEEGKEKPDLSALKEEDFPDYADLSEEERRFLPQLSFARIQQLARKCLRSGENSAPSDAVSVDVTRLEKESRKLLHGLIRDRFPHLQTQTVSVVEKGQPDQKESVLKVFYQAKLSKETSTRGWPRDRPRYLEFTLHKQHLDHHELVSSLGRILHAGRKRFSFAGTKDKRARTTQRARVSFATPSALAGAVRRAGFRDREREVVAVGDFRYVREELKLGDLAGNRFELVLRNVAEADVPSVDAAFRALRESGFVNYFGLQRFGTTAIKTSDVGLALIKKEWKCAIESILVPRENDRPWLRRAREHWWQYRDPDRALRILGTKSYGSLEGKMLQGLRTCDEANPMGALDFLPRSMRMMYLHAYQSLVFNQVVSSRLDRFGMKVLVGDLFTKGEIIPAEAEESFQEDEEDKTAKKASSSSSSSEDQTPSRPRNKEQIERVTEENLSEVSIFDVVLPLPGEDVEYPDNDTKAMYESELAKDGLHLRSFTDAHRQYALSGDYRKIIGKVKDLEWRVVRYDDPREVLTASEVERHRQGEDGAAAAAAAVGEREGVEGRFFGVVVAFTVGPSQYATMVVREATKTSTARDVQSKLSAEHDDMVRKREEGRKRVYGKNEEEEESAPDEGGDVKRVKAEQEEVANL